MNRFRVIADGLNLRSAPTTGGNVIAVLPKNQIVTKLVVASNDNWWKVATTLNGGSLEGFVAHRFLTSDTAFSVESFDLPNPADGDRGSPLTLWATFYNVHTAQGSSGGNPLLDLAGSSLGPTLSDRDWCNAAVEGTVRILDASSNVVGTYNFAGRGSTEQVNCSRFFPGLSSSIITGTNRARFKVSKGAYGEGTRGFTLVPYRTVAVDDTFIPIGSAVFIPEARGKTVLLPSGRSVTHDGYFFAADVGGAIKDNHIDVFLGVSTANPFAFIQSRRDRTFSAFLIRNSQTVGTLEALHRV
ncbi:SH3 domain-containing protein [Leptolyngbya sp. FACHB-541]|uniref:3D domain-containing protein n=1 Tax=Leptolyngbya sp. FACHB-541 TaxID=2692810 RepID=UPI001688A188|nr:3D domain-containing protein [Leptolyngbya sp. FACHB-541]MBD1995219.1 SH3 domain-containing protein [Leptolyngbya sp. FACHB-541]